MKEIIKQNRFGYLLVLLAFVAVIIQNKVTAGLELMELRSHPVFYVIYGLTILYYLQLGLKLFLSKHKQSLKISKASISILMSLGLLNFVLFNGNFLITSHFTSWLLKYFMVLVMVYMALPFQNYLPKLFWVPMQIIIGSSLLVAAYFIIYLFPTYSLLVASGFLFGITLLGFVPILMLWYSIHLIRTNKEPIQQLNMVAGIVVPVLLVSIYCFQWYKKDTALAQIQSSELVTKAPINSTTEKILMGEYVYDSFQHYWQSGKSGEINKKHDPLVSVALFVSNKNHLNQTERIEILDQRFSDFKGAHLNVWQATLHKNNSIINNNSIKNWQWYIIIFLFPMLIILTFYKLKQTDF